MLLSYYDTYWDDTLISENYDMITMLSTNKLRLNVESPGIYTENSSIVQKYMTTEDYYQAVEQYSNAHLHLKLIQMGKEMFGHYKFDDSNNPCGLNYTQLQELIDYYLYDYMNFDKTKISYSSTNTNVRQFVINNIKKGTPVLVRMGTSSSNIGHAFILYDYDETNDELYGHWGWKSNLFNFEHIKLSTTPYNVFWDATILNVNTEHNCSNNYKYSDGYDYLETYCSCKLAIHEKHNHSYVYSQSDSNHIATCVDCDYTTTLSHVYDQHYCIYCNAYTNVHDYDRNYVWVNNTTHRVDCSCGATTTEGHVISSNSYNSGQRFATCLTCGGRAEMGFIQLNINSSAVTKVTINGSFILPNGIIIIKDEDLEAYFNNTLIFYDKNHETEIK